MFFFHLAKSPSAITPFSAVPNSFTKFPFSFKSVGTSGPGPPSASPDLCLRPHSGAAAAATATAAAAPAPEWLLRRGDEVDYILFSPQLFPSKNGRFF